MYALGWFGSLLFTPHEPLVSVQLPSDWQASTSTAVGTPTTVSIVSRQCSPESSVKSTRKRSMRPGVTVSAAATRNEAPRSGPALANEPSAGYVTGPESTPSSGSSGVSVAVRPGPAWPLAPMLRARTTRCAALPAASAPSSRLALSTRTHGPAMPATFQHGCRTLSEMAVMREGGGQKPSSEPPTSGVHVNARAFSSVSP